MTFTDDYNSTITGDFDGINARHFGSGALSITTTGTVTGVYFDGISALSEGTNLTITAENVSGRETGVGARNMGDGALSITTTGAVTASNGIGIDARNYGTDLTINTVAVMGDDYGIHAISDGSGALSITATGTVTASSGNGIRVQNYGTDLTIDAVDVSGGYNGVNANNYGTGSMSITTTGEVVGEDEDGIRAKNYGTDLTISTGRVSGGEFGIQVRNGSGADLSVSTIYAESAISVGTSGALTVTATDDVSGATRSGIAAWNYGTDLTITAVNVSGAQNGIYALNDSTGALSVSTTGHVIGDELDGINVLNFGTDLTINAADVSGGYNGIYAKNQGTGALSITSTGAVTGGDGGGIVAFNYYLGTDLSISAANVSGERYGINVANLGTGALSVTATGDVRSTNALVGVHARGFGTDLTVSTASVSGTALLGIFAANHGSGATSVTTTDDVSGEGIGVAAGNSGYATDLTISVANVIGGDIGVYATNYGNGALSVTATGSVVGTDYDGIRAGNYAADLTITAVDVSGGENGIQAVNRIDSAILGSPPLAENAEVESTVGAITITTTGDVIGANQRGIMAWNFGTDLTISAANVSGGESGIYAQNEGTGALTVTTTGDVTGTNDVGVYAYNAATGTDLTVVAANVSGGTAAILANNSGSGTTDVTVNGRVSGGTDAALQATSLAGTLTRITLNDGADLSSVTGDALVNNESDSLTTFNTGSSATGVVTLADGSDEVVLAGGDISGVTLLNGGDDSSAADGFIDTLRVTGLGYALSDSTLSNWEVLAVDGGTASFSDASFAIGDGQAGTGVSVLNGGRLSAGAAFTLNAPLSTASGSIFDASGAGNGAVVINGNVSNDGILSTQDGVAGDVITIAGDYTGAGIVALDVVLDGDASASDLLAVQGNTAGSGILSIANAGGGGDVTELGIEVISVAGTSAGQFALAGDFITESGEDAVVVGAYAYTLVQTEGGNWNLLSEITDSALYQPGSPVYETYAQSLLELNGTGSMRQRGSSQDYQQRAAASDSAPVQRISSSAQLTPSPFWIQMGYDNVKTAPNTSTTNATSDSNIWELHAGADAIFNEGETGFLVGGLVLNYATSDTKVASEFGNGTIDSTAMGVALAATWYDNRGFYVDGQLKFSRYESDLASASLGSLIQSNNGTGQALSLEIGQEYTVESGLTFIPQAQLTKSKIDYDAFTGPSSEYVNLKDAESLVLRLGVEVDQFTPLENGAQRFYGIANLYHEFEGANTVDVSGVTLANASENWTAEVGFGGSYMWDDSYSVYGEASYATGLKKIGDAQKISANLGLRMEF